MEALPQTLLAAVRYFSDLAVCHDYLKLIRWPDGKITCQHCGSDRIGEVATRRLLRCKDCRKQIYPKQGTIFEDSPLGLDKWFPIIYAEANQIKVSSGAMAELLGTTQKSAWSMRQIIKSAKELIVQFVNLAEWPNYRVGQDGSVWTCRRKIGNRWVTDRDNWKQLNCTVHHDGYRYVSLYHDSKAKSKKVSVLVCTAFHGPKPDSQERQECRHKNGNRADDRSDNLEWGSTTENAADRLHHGKTAIGERNGFAKLTDDQVAELMALKGKTSQEKAGLQFGLSQVHVGRIWNGVNRKQTA